MRTLRLSMTGTVILMLLGGTSAAMASEADDAPAESTPVVVSGTLDCLGQVPASEAGEDLAAAEDEVVNLHKWEASDPRLAGEASYAGRWRLYQEPSEDSGADDAADAADAAIYAIVNEGGRWLCAASRTAPPRAASNEHTLVFSGDGGYEGLTAYLHVDWSQAPYAFSGLILPGDEPPYAVPQG